MMKRMKSLISLLLVIAILFCFAGCMTEAPPDQTAVNSPTAHITTEPSAGDTTAPAAGEYTEPLQDGYNQVTFYWTYPGTYENCDIWIWWGDVAGKYDVRVRYFSYASAHKCAEQIVADEKAMNK